MMSMDILLAGLNPQDPGIDKNYKRKETAERNSSMLRHCLSLICWAYNDHYFEKIYQNSFQNLKTSENFPVTL